MKLPFVSIIIPCYNGSKYIRETLKSILSQDGVDFEIVIVDDGSTDESRTLIDEFHDPSIKYIYQSNQGVSAARNHGLKYVKGDYLVFFDADDIMSSDFLFSRISFLQKNPDYDFVCGEVLKFGDNGFMDVRFRGTSFELVEEVLLYNPHVVTCPSNYLFKSSFIKDRKILFNTNLSSTADKFFLLECAKYGKSNFSLDVSELHYRVLPDSMSHKLTPKLVVDNENYYKELLKYELIPPKIKNKALFLGDFILFASYWKVNENLKSLKFAFISFLRNPFGFLKKVMF